MVHDNLVVIPFELRSLRASIISSLRDLAALLQSLNVIERYKTLDRANSPNNIIYARPQVSPRMDVKAIGASMMQNLALRFMAFSSYGLKLDTKIDMM